MYCPRCDCELKEGDVVCPQCGKKIRKSNGEMAW